VSPAVLAAPRWRLVTFDIDGTLTLEHGWGRLARSVGRREEYDRTQQRFRAGEIGEDEHLADLLRLADGLTVVEVGRVLESTPRVGGIREAIATWHDRGARVALLTHNPDYVCDWYVREFGFDAYAGTTVPVPADGRLRLPAVVHADKRSGLEELRRRFGVPPGAVAHVGDGAADAKVFPHVGAGVALNSAEPEVEAAADLVVHAEDLRGLPDLLDRLRPRADRAQSFPR
jgi:HAD superfamily phosphoserine phosphatase-like hydrolase